MAPVHDALSVPEVLKSIILSLPLRQIVHARIVCHEFRRLIDASGPIQRALFLQSSTSHTLKWHASENPQSRWQFHCSGEWKSEDGGVAEKIVINPFFTRVVNPASSICCRSQWSHCGPSGASVNLFVQPEEEFSCCFASNNAFDRDAGSHSVVGVGKVRDMLLTQPPVRELILVTVSQRLGSTLSCGVDHRGLVFSHLIEAILRSEKDSSLEVRGASMWSVLSKTVDELTGHEMLKILGSSIAELDDATFLKARGEADEEEWDEGGIEGEIWDDEYSYEGDWDGGESEEGGEDEGEGDGGGEDEGEGYEEGSD